MKIKKPVKEVPFSNGTSWGRHKEIWDAVQALPNGDWLPVECDSAKDARNLYAAARTHKTLAMSAKLRGLLVYIQRKQEQETGARNAG